MGVHGSKSLSESPEEPVPADWCAIPDTTLALAAGLPHVVVPQLVVPDVAVFLPRSSIALRTFNDHKLYVASIRPKHQRAEAADVFPCLMQLPHLTELSFAHVDVDYTVMDFVVKQLPGLQVLSLATAPWFLRSSNTLEYFGPMPRLRSLDLSGRPNAAAMMRSVIEQPALRELHFNSCHNMTADALAKLRKLPRLEVLSLRECDGVAVRALSHVAQLLHLRELDLQGCRISTLSELRHHPALEKLSVDVASASNDSLDLVPTLPRLHDLTVADVWLTEKGLAHIAQGSRLQRLSFEGCSIDSGSKCIGFLTELEFLRLHNFERFDLRHLKRLSQLRHLHLGRSPNVTTAALEHLSGLRNLETLSLSECAMPAESIQCIERLPHLTSLDVSRCRCVDESALLALAPRLRDLAQSDPHPHNVVYR